MFLERKGQSQQRSAVSSQRADRADEGVRSVNCVKQEAGAADLFREMISRFEFNVQQINNSQ
eukprot:scaffold73032_cov59-Cyclotella_meneghiniana.AAC.4